MRTDPRLLVPAALALVLAVLPPRARAFAWHECNGASARRQGNRAHFQILRCSIPQGSQRAADVLYSIDQWNRVEGMLDVLSWEWGPRECIGVEMGNGRNEIYFGVPAQMDGAAGVTAIRYDDDCFWWFDTQAIEETDVAINAAVLNEWGSPACNSLNPFGSRTTVVHELGHAVGLDHDDRFMNLMMTSDGEGKYCGSFVIEPHPDDADGGRFLYGSGRRSTDIGASAHRWAGSDDVERGRPDKITDVCPGDRFTFDWSVGNMGTEDVRYDVLFVVSQDKVIDISDVVASWNQGAFEPAGGFDTFRKTIVVPPFVSPGVEVWVGVILDFADRVPERFWSNNATYLASRLRGKRDCR